jgi:hypothetical protein
MTEAAYEGEAKDSTYNMMSVWRNSKGLLKSKDNDTDKKKKRSFSYSKPRVKMTTAQLTNLNRNWESIT